jgi:hypothetical protein
MRLTTIICGGLLCAMTGSAVACTLPKLAILPPKDQAAGKEGELTIAMTEYSTGMDAYVGCIRAELDAAGGDNAPAMIRRVLVSRNNTAVAEKEFMIKLYAENVSSAAPVDPAAPAASAEPRRARAVNDLPDR